MLRKPSISNNIIPLILQFIEVSHIIINQLIMLEENIQHPYSKTHEKALKASRMNDTYAQWRQAPKKKFFTNPKHHLEQHQRFLSLNDLPLHERVQEKLKRNDVKGLTLDQYFKARENLQLETDIKKINQQDEEELNKYRNEQFQMDGYIVEGSNSHKQVQTPQFNHFPEVKQKQVRKKSNNKQILKATRMKTETMQCQHLNKSKCKNKNTKHLATNVDQQQQHMPMLDTFYKGIRKNNKAQYEPKISKKCRMLDKVQQQKERLVNMQASDMSFVTKHALKFNINKNICRQLILDERRN